MFYWRRTLNYAYGMMQRRDDRRYWRSYWVCWSKDYKTHEGESIPRAVADDYGVLVPV